MNAPDNNLLASVDARTKLAGSNRMEILLFSLGTSEIFGINVFKVREVANTPAITKTPNMPPGVAGLISLRGKVIPVVSLAKVMGLNRDQQDLGGTMMITEYSKRTLSFLVHGVDRIVRVDWDRVRAPDALNSGNDEHFITALTELDSGRLVSILDVEQIMANTFGEAVIGDIQRIEHGSSLEMFFVDDSLVARKKIMEILDKLGVGHKHAVNGVEAWNRLAAMASHAEQNKVDLHDHLKLILVDAEMPEMDGYVLTKKIKSDSRFANIPIIMHSSLSSEANRAMGKAVGVDAYVAKFDGDILAETIRPYLTQ